jgi:hypothetical protein
VTAIDKPHVLYRMFDVDKNLLYVGISNSAGSRWSNHANDKPWWPEVGSVEVEHFANRETVEHAERQAIDLEKPKYNIAHRTTSTPAERDALLQQLAQNEYDYIEATFRRKAFVKQVFAMDVGQRPPVFRMAEVTGLSRARLYQIRDLD